MRKPKPGERCKCPDGVAYITEVDDRPANMIWMIPTQVWDSKLPNKRPITYGLLPDHSHRRNGPPCDRIGWPATVQLIPAYAK